MHAEEDCMHRELVHQFLDLEKERIKAWGIRSMIKVIQF